MLESTKDLECQVPAVKLWMMRPRDAISRLVYTYRLSNEREQVDDYYLCTLLMIALRRVLRASSPRVPFQFRLIALALRNCCVERVKESRTLLSTWTTGTKVKTPRESQGKMLVSRDTYLTDPAFSRECECLPLKSQGLEMFQQKILWEFQLDRKKMWQYQPHFFGDMIGSCNNIIVQRIMKVYVYRSLISLQQLYLRVFKSTQD